MTETSASLGVRAAFFDLDGTLVDREPIVEAAVWSLLAREGRHASSHESGATIGRAWQDVHAELDIAEHHGWSVLRFVELVLEEVDVLAASGATARILTGGAALVRRLHGQGVAVGIVSGSTRREVAAAAVLLEVDEILALRHGAEDYAIGKPDPACYLGAAAHLDVAPADCVVFEDSTAGIAAGRAAGMRVVATAEANAAFGQPGHQDLSRAHLVVADLGEVTNEALRSLWTISSD